MVGIEPTCSEERGIYSPLPYHYGGTSKILYHIETYYLVLTYGVGLSPATVVICFNMVPDEGIEPPPLDYKTRALPLCLIRQTYHIETH
jgi:hypothetical protein